MTTVTKALDHLTDVLAGSDVTLKGTKADCIMQLADMIDDGTIVIGGGGGEGAFIVHFSFDMGTGTYTSDKTLAEILAAAEAGQAVFGTMMNGTEFQFVGADAEHGAQFQAYMIDSDSVLQYFNLIIAVDDSITTAQSAYDLSSLIQS